MNPIIADATAAAAAPIALTAAYRRPPIRPSRSKANATSNTPTPRLPITWLMPACRHSQQNGKPERVGGHHRVVVRLSDAARGA